MSDSRNSSFLTWEYCILTRGLLHPDFEINRPNCGITVSCLVGTQITKRKERLI